MQYGCLLHCRLCHNSGPLQVQLILENSKKHAVSPSSKAAIKSLQQCLECVKQEKTDDDDDDFSEEADSDIDGESLSSTSSSANESGVAAGTKAQGEGDQK